MVWRRQAGRHGTCTILDKESAMTKTENNPACAESSAPDIEQECEIWDWARAAGASAEELRKALLDSLGSAAAGYSPT
jgi:hypothetical protein